MRAAAETPDDQGHVKRVVAEMGGKNGVIVDSDADLDEAVPAILRSAFVYAGQKCSACSRVLVHEGIADALEERLAGAAASLAVGQAESFATDVPPVIEREARDRVRSYAERAAAEGRLVAAPVTSSRPRAGSARRRSSPGCRRRLAGAARGDLRPARGGRAARDIDAACDALEASPFALTGRPVLAQPAHGRAR